MQVKFLAIGGDCNVGRLGLGSRKEGGDVCGERLQGIRRLCIVVG